MIDRQRDLPRTILLAALVLLAAPVGGSLAQEEEGGESRGEQIKREAISNYEERTEARRVLADLLASDSIQRMEFVATSRDQAMHRVNLVVEALFSDAYSRLGDVARAQQQCEAVIYGFNDHSIRLSSVGRTTGAVEITTDADARLAGELLAAVARLVDRLEEKLGETKSPRRIARKIFSQTTIYETSAASPINQYLETVTELAGRSDEELERYFGSS